MKIKMRSDLEKENKSIPVINRENRFLTAKEISDLEFIYECEVTGDTAVKNKEGELLILYSIDLEYVEDSDVSVVKASHQYGYNDERINCLVIKYEGKTYSWIWFEDSVTPLNFIYEGDLSWTKFKNLPSRHGEGIKFPEWLNVHDFFDMYEDAEGEIRIREGKINGKSSDDH